MAGLGPTEAQTVRLSPGIVRQTNLGGKWWEILEVGNISTTHSFFFLLKNPGIPRAFPTKIVQGLGSNPGKATPESAPFVSLHVWCTGKET